MDSEDRNMEFLACKNVIGIMIEAMHDCLNVYDNAIEEVLLERYRIAISFLERQKRELEERVRVES